eukprot:TRINITY_DN3469_c1_g1_i1.p1 TRINITY_DN3469_c1_g1~~TRINITY_DN3469_c1_g1_i1.p1  ORF type:complete len:179 (+),score=47.14 TRINITY_DN3469_c1_g1_i1:293-829(+)
MTLQDVMQRVLGAVVLHAAVAAAASAAERIADAKLQYGALPVGVLQILPPLAAQVVTLSPLSTMATIRSNASTGSLPLLPYSMMACSGFLWICYGTLTGDHSIIAANVSALVLGLWYCRTFVQHKSQDADVQRPVAIACAGSLAVCLAVVSLERDRAIDSIGRGWRGRVGSSRGAPAG